MPVRFGGDITPPTRSLSAHITITIIAVALLAACGGDDASSAKLDLTLRGLPPLGAGYVYEGWLITADGPKTSGRFELTKDGEQTLSFDVDTALADQATKFVLTIEPKDGDDPAPAATHVLAGTITGGVAELSTGDAAALGSDFKSAAGTFILETPSSADTNDYASGVWFLDPSAGPGPSLTLPKLPDGWVYEGWVVGKDGPVSTGRFSSASGADSDAAGPTAGTDGKMPPFPGQDFISPLVDLTQSFKVVISVEPEPDDSPMPAPIKPLIADVTDAGAGVAQMLDNNAAASVPSGRAELR